jgi:hypothetical protein
MDFFRRIPDFRPLIGRSVDVVRDEHAQMTDEEWVKRIVRDGNLPVEAPEGYNFSQSLMEELASVPPEGMRHARGEDAPPPPLVDDDGVVIPEHIYSNGLMWTVGCQIGKGVSGKVFEVSHRNGREQQKRIVKIMCVPDNKERRGSFWNEIAATMFTGDFVGSEIMQQNGETWAALVLERHKGKTAWDHIQAKEGFEELNEFISDPKAMFQVAVMIRSVVHTLRRMHSAGWIHRDVKPGNIIFNTDEGEESLSRLIDFGIAKRAGNVRKEVEEFFVGSPRFSLPEATMNADMDLRIRDYWGVMITAALEIGLVSDIGENTIADCFDRLQKGKKYVAPEFDNQIKADAFFKKYGLSEAQKSFLKWMYNFLRPKDDIESRRDAWQRSGITRKLPVDQIPSELWAWEQDRDGRELEVAFLNDDKFVRELDGHLRALGAQIGRKDVDKTLALLQEFPEVA